MIENAMQSLISLVKTVPAFAGRVGASVGGTDIDPTMSQIPLPYAWVLFGGDAALDEGGNGKIMQQVDLQFTVHVVVSHADEAGMLSTQLPLLEAVSAAIRGQNGPTGCFKWKYLGQGLDAIESDSVRYVQGYSIIGHYK